MPSILQKACQKLSRDIPLVYIFSCGSFCQNDKEKSMCFIYKKGCFLRIFI